MDKKQIQQNFVSPGAEYRGKPFWSWNGELRADELVRQAGIMKEMGLGGYFMHSRSGLITEYLGDDWFDCINKVADESEKLGMEAWLYDEDRGPSGSAGGKVTVDPQYRMKSLYVFESSIEKYEPHADTIALYAAKLDGLNLWCYKKLDSGDVKTAFDAAVAELSASDTNVGEWKLLCFAIVPDPCDSNYNGTTYIDTMSFKATHRFIEMTHEEYKRHCGDRIGRSIKGIFTDEPHRGHCFDNRRDDNGVISCAVCWTDDLFDEFVKRYGFDAKALLPELFYRFNGKHVSPVKLYYIDLANNLFIERFAIPINDWCKQNNMIFTGHVLHEDSLMNQTVPNGSLMRFYEYMGYPGIDCLGEHNHGYWIAKQLSSAARQLGKKWLLSELYGCTGWQFNFRSHKTVGDWQALFGINLRCQHLSWYTMEGESKRDYPASILHQSPWYPYYPAVEDYFSRFGLVMSEGSPECDVLVLNPIESLWCQAHLGWSNWINNTSADIAPYEQRYAQLFHMLTDHHIDFDYGEEQMMSRHASIGTDHDGKPVIRVGNGTYHVAVVADMLTMRESTLNLLRQFAKAGGKIVFAGDVPAYVDAVESNAPSDLASKTIAVQFDEQALVAAVRANAAYHVNITDATGKDDQSVFIQVRNHFGEDAKAFVAVNTDLQNAHRDLLVSMDPGDCRHVEFWQLESGKRFNADAFADFSGNKVNLTISLEAAGSACYVLTKEADPTLETLKQYETIAEHLVSGDFPLITDEPNVCVLDWVKWRRAGEAWSDETEALRADRQVRDSVGIEHRGGSMLQPWYSKLNDTKHYGKLELSYEFTVDVIPSGELFLAGERPELIAYAINGVKLENRDNHDFWVDDCFKKMRIPDGVIKAGTNVVTAEVDFMRTTNIEAVYLIGQFGVAIDGKKRTLTSLPDRIGFGNYEAYDMPFYTGSLTYRLTPEYYAGLTVKEGERIMLSPKSFMGGCVVVTASGRSDILAWEPYQADVTEAVRNNETIDVTVVGTRRNVFGPLHQIPKLAGSYGPGSFVTGGKDWTDDYSLLDSGATGIILRTERSL